jgi:hypothetical protein
MKFLFLEFNSVLNRLADMTTGNVDSMEVHHNTWTSQIKDVKKKIFNRKLPVETITFSNDCS